MTEASWFCRVAFAAVLALCLGGPSLAIGEEPKTKQRPWQDKFDIEKRTNLTTGSNRFFILKPGYQIVLASRTEQVFITVLNETVKVNGIETRVVEEREFARGKLKEVSRNFFTICKEHGDVFYHGEDVDDYKVYSSGFLGIVESESSFG